MRSQTQRQHGCFHILHLRNRPWGLMSPQTASLMEIRLNIDIYAEQHCWHSRAAQLARLMNKHAVCRGAAVHHAVLSQGHAVLLSMYGTLDAAPHSGARKGQSQAAIAAQPDASGTYGLWKPLRGALFFSGVWPPSNPSLGFLPAVGSTKHVMGSPALWQATTASLSWKALLL